MHIWDVFFVEYTIAAGLDVTILHWKCSKVIGDFAEWLSGEVAADGHYPDLPSIEAVPKATWEALAKAELGVVEVKRIEDSIDAALDEQMNPTHGGFEPT